MAKKLHAITGWSGASIRRRRRRLVGHPHLVFGVQNSTMRIFEIEQFSKPLVLMLCKLYLGFIIIRLKLIPLKPNAA